MARFISHSNSQCKFVVSQIYFMLFDRLYLNQVEFPHICRIFTGLKGTGLGHSQVKGKRLDATTQDDLCFSS